ncbi:MAG: 4-hydroxythreonine-4-phosphate dehydrogenase PdxA [Candidatus Omnitrophica bacterium]|nr:4-hydroxythreonine-4-phosphate dehydrogenase PdxA [Candidatus Omnitrophota bacterium]
MIKAKDIFVGEKIGITVGDPNGVGPEIIVKALAKTTLRRGRQFVIYGNSDVLAFYQFKQYRNVVVKDPGGFSLKNFKPGTGSAASGRAALAYLRAAVQDLQAGKIRSVATAPLSKELVGLAHPGFRGHTEYLAEAFGKKDDEIGMLFVAGSIRLILATRHLALRQVPDELSPERLYKAVKLLNDALKKYFLVPFPNLAVCGLNPHAGEGGVLGTEEIEIINPVLDRCRKEKIRVSGPLPADTLFVPDIFKKYDAAVAMYHDQGLIPIKLMAFNRLVNMTVGLPVLRTSPAHGTAFNIAGKGLADPSSMMEALRLATELI